LRWFTLNFEGENQEELDFLKEKEEHFTSAAILATEVVSYWNRVADKE